MNKTKTVKHVEIGSQTEPSNELPSVNAQATPAREVKESTKDEDEYSLVDCSSFSVYAAETNGKKEQGDESYMEESGDSEEAITNTAIRAPRPAVDTNDKQKPCSLASGKTDMIQCPKRPCVLQHQHIKGHFKKNLKDLFFVYRICKGIPGVQYCQRWVSHHTLGKHLTNIFSKETFL